MNRRQVVLNALTTLAQVIAGAAVLFFLYRFLIRALGIERLGIWSLILATTSVVTLANQGFATSIVKFVAKYVARENTKDVSLLIQTAVISITLALAVISVGLYPGAKWILKIVLPPASLSEAYAILPLALASLWFTILEGILQAGLAGHELITYCNYLELGGSVSYLLLAFLLVPGYGLFGLACAQAAVGAALVVTTWLLLRRRVPGLPIVPRRWNGGLFREMAAYGLQFQLITASQALREPVTKALITKFGGLSMTGFYDMASRWVVTVRELIVQANQVLIPTVSNLQERAPGTLSAIYRESYRLIFFLAVPAFAFVVVLSPLVSRIWLGHYEPVFVLFVAILAAAWLVNVLSNPAYVLDLGTGALRWVSIACVGTAVINAGLGFFAGMHGARLAEGGLAVVAASAFSLACGYIVVAVSYHVKNDVPFGQLLPKESGAILIASIAAAAIFLPFFCASPGRSSLSLPTMIEAAVAMSTVILVPMWIHPMRKQLLRWIFSRVAA
jgi:O-antigen/teichoic acid export membrane protein